LTNAWTWGHMLVSLAILSGMILLIVKAGKKRRPGSRAAWGWMPPNTGKRPFAIDLDRH